MKKIFILFLSLITALTITGCGEKSVSENDKIQVYTSFYAMYDFANQIGGDKTEVHILCPTGQEPHDFEPTARDIADISSADVFVYNGMGMEHWVNTVVDTLGDSDVICVNTTENIPTKTDDNDPHVWLNPDNAYIQMLNIYNALIAVDPENTEYYSSNLNSCKEKIDTLINDYTSAVNGFKSNDIVVSHQAYGNLCAAFGLNQIPINGITNTDDPSPAQMAATERYIKDNGITHIFKEPLGTSSVVETIANDTKTQILVLDPFEGSTENKDYFTVMYENLDAIKIALN